jgi:hypothetical protein
MAPKDPSKSKSAVSRHKMKETDPERYKEYLDVQRVRAKKGRMELKAELQKRKPSDAALTKKEKQLELQRARQSRYEENLKKDAGNVKRTMTLKRKQASGTQTRHSTIAKKEYNRTKKQKQRETLTPQKKMWIKKKDRDRKAAKKAKVHTVPLNRARTSTLPSIAEEPIAHKDTVCENAAPPFKSRQTEYNVTRKVKKTLPGTPTKFAKVIGNIIRSATPRKRKALHEIKTYLQQPMARHHIFQ